MDLILHSVKCDDSRPVYIYDNYLSMTCGGKNRCRFVRGNAAIISGKLVINGVEDYAEDDTEVAIMGGVDTFTDYFEIDQVVDLCKLSQEYNTNSAGNDDGYTDDTYNGDDAKNDDFYNDDVTDDIYNNDDAANGNDDAAAANGDDYYANGDDGGNRALDQGDDYYAAQGDDDANNYYNGDDAADAEDCPADGVYEFEALLRLPNGRWMATGWGATANMKMYSHDGTVLGSCDLVFKTATTSVLIMPANVFVIMSIIVGGAFLFYAVFALTNREAKCTYCAPCCAGDGLYDFTSHYKNMDDDEDQPTDDEGAYYTSGGETDEEVPPVRMIGGTEMKIVGRSIVKVKKDKGTMA